MAGGGHTCAQRGDLSLVCWGFGLFGQLGNEKGVNIGDEPAEMGGMLVPVNLGSGIYSASVLVCSQASCGPRDGCIDRHTHMSPSGVAVHLAGM